MANAWTAAVRGLSEVDPLGVHELAVSEELTTDDPEEARIGVARALSMHEIELLGSPTRFRAHYAAGRLNGLTVLELGYGGPVRIRRPARDYVGLVVPLTGSVEFGQAGRRRTARPYRAMALFGSDSEVDARFAPGTRTLIVRLDPDALASAWRRLAPDEREGAPRFTTDTVTGAAGYGVYGSVQLLAKSWAEYGSAERLPPALGRVLGQHLLTSVLLGIPHSESAALLDLASPASGQRVREAVELVMAESAAERTVLDLAHDVGVGVRALELGFRRELGRTPSEFLREARLQRAHEELQAADETRTTVSDIAMRWGFANHGRFARAYRARYGRLPSATLRDPR